MKDSIKPGDLVMVVRPTTCCGSAHNLGKIGTIISKVTNPNGVQCTNCGHWSDGNGYFRISYGRSHEACRLKKIDPPALDESVERVRELEQA